MTIFNDPYHTTTGAVHSMDRVTKLLKETTIRDPLTGTNLGVNTVSGIVPVFITGCRDSETGIPLFTHPISVNNFNGKSYLFTDLRLFVSSGAVLPDLTGHIRRQEEFAFTKSRAIASLAWAGSDDTSRFGTGMRFAGEVFSAWLAQTIAKAFGLDFTEQIKTQLIASAYYASLFKKGGVHLKDNEDLTLQLANQANSAKLMPLTVAKQFLQGLDPLDSIHSFCDQIAKSLGENVRLKDFNLRILLNLIANSWYATNSKEILAVALEHPPTWATIVFYCIRSGNFKKSLIGTTIASVNKRGNGESFTTAYESLMLEFTEERGQARSVMEHLDPNASRTPLTVPEFE